MPVGIVQSGCRIEKKTFKKGQRLAVLEASEIGSRNTVHFSVSEVGHPDLVAVQHVPYSAVIFVLLQNLYAPKSLPWVNEVTPSQPDIDFGCVGPVTMG